MRLRTLTIWHKFKKLWLALLGWLVASVVMMAFLGWMVQDYNGGFARISPSYQTVLEADSAKRLEISAQGVRLEIAGSVDNKKVRAYLYGADYAGQTVRLYQQEETVYIHLAEFPVAADNFGYPGGEELTLRVIVPKQDYEKIIVTAKRTEAVVQNLRSDMLKVQLDSGSLHLDKLDHKQAMLDITTAQVTLDDVSIHDLTLANKSGDTMISRSKLRHFQYQGGSGDLQVRQKNIKGIWQLQSVSGNIIIQTNRTPYDLLCQLHSARGNVQVDYQKYDWPELLASHLAKGDFHACIGEGRQMLFAEADRGNITIGKR